MLYVNEIFSGLEGEGHNPGTPTIRVRLQGCSVMDCKIRRLCDQPEALGPGSKSREMTEAQILATVLDLSARAKLPYDWVSISGGEPLDQLIEPLIWDLQRCGKKVRIETSGPRRLEGPIEYIRVSPKYDRPSPKTKQDWGLELSLVWTGSEDLEAWEQWGSFAMRTLQPAMLRDGSSNVEEVIRICQERPIWQLSVQVHKFLRIP